MKKNYLLSIIVMGLIVLSLYSTYAMFTETVETNDIVTMNASVLPLESKIVEYERVEISAQDKKTIEFTVNNDTNNALYYGAWYEMVNPSILNDDIVIGKKEDTQSDTKGQLIQGAIAKVTFVIENKTSSPIKVNIGVGYSSDNNLNLPANRILITEVYKDIVLATDYIINLYNSAPKSTFVNNNIQYERAESVSLMTDIGDNIRYYGADPNNYVKFNNELWRIIGVFKDIDDGTGKTETRIKIAKNDSIGNYAWNSNSVNEWSTATLNTYLNGTYLNSLSTEAQGMISNAVWNLGGWDTSELYANQFYDYERGTTVYSGRSIEWTGKIALMYPSDYLYSSNLGTCTRNANWWDSSGCVDTSWLFDGQSEWLLTPYSSNSYSAFSVYTSGYVNVSSNVSHSNASRPVLYLSSTVQIIGGDGTFGNPYTLLN